LATETPGWPPDRAAWIPGSIVHRADYTTRSSVRIAHIDTMVFDGSPRG
jgi:hypothetical protein